MLGLYIAVGVDRVLVLPQRVQARNEPVNTAPRCLPDSPQRLQGFHECSRCYPSDLSDAEWAVIEPLLPARHRRGRPPVHPRRVIVNATLYVNRAGGAWRYLPKDFPPWRTVYGYFAAWRDNGALQRPHDRLRDAARAAAGRDSRPTAAVIDSQPVRAADTVPKASRGWDNAKKVNGRKRDAHAFEVLPRRWAVERTLAWITACRRCSRDYERLPASHEAMVLWAMIALMTQRLATD
jgi:transposase